MNFQPGRPASRELERITPKDVVHAPPRNRDLWIKAVTLCMEGGGEQPAWPYWMQHPDGDMAKVTCQDCLEWMHA